MCPRTERTTDIRTWVILLQTVRISKKKYVIILNLTKNFFSRLVLKWIDTYIRILSKIFFSPDIIIENFDSYVYFARFYHV